MRSRHESINCAGQPWVKPGNDDAELQSLLVAIQKLDEAAQSLGIDVVAELKSGHTLTDIFEMIAERQPIPLEAACRSV